MRYTHQDMDNDFQWFLDNYDDLYQKNGHKFYAIQNKQILGMYDDQNEAIDETMKTHPLGMLCVQECNGDESGYTVTIMSRFM